MRDSDYIFFSHLAKIQGSLVDTCSYCHNKSPILVIKQSQIDYAIKRRSEYVAKIKETYNEHRASIFIENVSSPDYIMKSVMPVCLKCDRKLEARDKDNEPLIKTLSNIKEGESRELERHGIKDAEWFQNGLHLERCSTFGNHFQSKTTFAADASGVYCYRLKNGLLSMCSSNAIEVRADLLLGSLLPVPKELSDDEKWEWKMVNWGVPLEICGIKTYESVRKKRQTKQLWAYYDLVYSFESACAPPFNAIKAISERHRAPTFHLSYHKVGAPQCGGRISYKRGRINKQKTLVKHHESGVVI